MNTTTEVLGFAREASWLPWAVQYFFLIGCSTAAFFLSLPGLVWRRPEWRLLSQHALHAALVCGLIAPVALLADLHQPGRFLNFYLHPNLQSWMAWGAFFIPLYLLGLLLYAWLCLRPRLAALAGRHAGRLGGLYRGLAYGGHANLGATRAAAVVAALGACLVLLYTGMEVMAVRARPLWDTPFLPLLLAVTALAGGLGMSGLFAALDGHAVLPPPFRRWLALSQWVTLALLAIWLALALGGAPSGAEALAATRGSADWRLTFGWLLASSALTLWLALRRPALVLPSLFALHGAWLLRWILLIGGQELPKLGAAAAPYALALSPGSLLGIVGTAGLALALYLALTSFIPWDESTEA